MLQNYARGRKGGISDTRIRKLYAGGLPISLSSSSHPGMTLNVMVLKRQLNDYGYVSESLALYRIGILTLAHPMTSQRSSNC